MTNSLKPPIDNRNTLDWQEQHTQRGGGRGNITCGHQATINYGLLQRGGQMSNSWNAYTLRLWCCFVAHQSFHQGGLLTEIIFGWFFGVGPKNRCKLCNVSCMLFGTSLCSTHSNVLWINSQWLYKHTALFISSPQSLGQETVPPAPLPTTKTEVNFSIGFDLNGDLTFCLSCVKKYYKELGV